MANNSPGSAGLRNPELSKLLEAIVDSCNDVVLSKDPQGTITSWNRSAERTFGYTASEAIGRPISLIVPSSYMEEERRLLERIRRGEQIRHFQTVRQRRDGSLLDVAVTISPILDTDGNIIGASTVGRDISAEKQVERRLVDSEARYRQLAEQISDGIFRAGQDGRYLDANTAGLEMFGYTLEELKQRQLPDLLALEEIPKLAEQIKVLAAGGVVQNEWRFRKKDGSTFTGELSSRQLADNTYQSVLRDITARVEVEKERRTTSALLSAILESTPDLIWVKDAEARFTLGNPSTMVFFGEGRREQVIGHRVTEVRGYAAADLMRLFESDRRILEGTPAQLVEEELEHPSRTVTLHTFRAPLYDPNGAVIGIIGISRDISVRKRMEIALRQSEERFRLLAEQGPHLVWILDENGMLEYANQRAQEVAAAPFPIPCPASRLEEMVHSADRGSLQVALAQAHADRGPFELELRLQFRDGSSRWHILRGVPYADADSRTRRWCVTATDIQSQKVVQEELGRINRDLEQFAHSASHDLREPLRTVLIYGQLLRRLAGDKLDQQAQSYLAHVQNGALRMSELLDGLLAYLQASATEPAGMTVVDAAVCFERACRSLSQAIADANAEVTCTPLPPVAVAEIHLEQLFQNLLGNAMKYAKKDVAPRIAVRASPHESEWMFSVQDNGIGIPPEYRERVFGLFKRLHTRDEYSGTGLGLALCARVVERYGGRIWVESEVGVGSTFYFTLPRVQS